MTRLASVAFAVLIAFSGGTGGIIIASAYAQLVTTHDR
jgi:hypothetical protein